MTPERQVTRPNSFIFTLYGDMVHRYVPSGAMRISSLVKLMAPFGISEAALRQAVSRMSRQGWLAGSKVQNRAYYAVTERGRRRIEGLSPRIYGPVIEWDGRWRLLTYNVAERHRERRDRLRKELAVLGWAPLSASTWLSPRDSIGEVRELIAGAGLDGSVDVFEGSYAGPHSDRELLVKCWDLQAIAVSYNDFIATYEPRLLREREQRSLKNEEAYIERLWLVHDYRKFTYIDPGLPSELLPAHWPGTLAAALFREYYAAIEKKSHAFFAAASGQAGHA